MIDLPSDVPPVIKQGKSWHSHCSKASAYFPMLWEIIRGTLCLPYHNSHLLNVESGSLKYSITIMKALMCYS